MILMSERDISLDKYIRTLKKTMQKFFLMDVILIYRIYNIDREFTIMTQGQGLCDMMNGRLKSIYSKNYAQVFSKYYYFDKVYPMD